MRNTILREATGKWLFFVDGDDLLPEEFSAVAKSLLHLPYDLIFFDYISCQEQVFRHTASIGQPVIELSPQVLEAYCISCATGAPCRLADARLHSVRYTSVWAKAYRRAFLLEQNLWFPEKQEKSQDVLFNTLVYYACRSAAYIPVVMYGYRKHPNSVCNRYHSDFLPGMEQYFFIQSTDGGYDYTFYERITGRLTGVSMKMKMFPSRKRLKISSPAKPAGSLSITK